MRTKKQKLSSERQQYKYIKVFLLKLVENKGTKLKIMIEVVSVKRDHKAKNNCRIISFNDRIT